MSQGGYVTLVGFVAREPMLRNTKDGRSVADVRIGTTSRYLDRETDLWRDGETCYYTVNCWRRLADNVRASLHKGDPVVVKGKFRTRTYTDREGTVKTEAEIVADTIGHDLSRGIANFLRPPKPRSDTVGDLGPDEVSRAAGGVGGFDETDDYADEANGPDDTGEEPMPGGANTPPFADPGSGGQRIEETVEDFTHGLDDPEAMARELGESEGANEPALPF
jgi:single-strand DNA-binding protein